VSKSFDGGRARRREGHRPDNQPMNQRFQFSVRPLLVLMTIATAVAARMHYNRENEIALALSHLQGIEKLQAKISPVQPTLEGKQFFDYRRSDQQRWEKRLKELRDH
jgi:hypothetical protein